jgi:hypothetical protein
MVRREGKQTHTHATNIGHRRNEMNERREEGNKWCVLVSQQHILGFATSLYNYILIKKDIGD